MPGGVGVARQQQQRQSVHRRQARGGDQVQRARADRGGHRQGGVATGGLGVRGSNVGDVLLVAALDKRQLVRQFVEGLAQSGHVAVPENAQGRWDEPAPRSVGQAVLGGKEFHDRLRGGQADRLV